MTAAEYVALAKRAAHNYFLFGARPFGTGFRLHVAWNGVTWITSFGKHWEGVRDAKEVLAADLSAANIASEDALVRALLASAVTVKIDSSRITRAEHFLATLDGEPFGHHSATREAALASALDALLALAEAR